ncbi:L-lactate permease, partial [Candidatus Gracilibacteria bacterium]|nr:L-lactate permease [Candidatus Gracilibacteria bacterium]
MSGAEIARPLGLYHLALGWIMALLMMRVVTRSQAASSTSRGIWGWTLLAAALFLIPMWLIATFVGPELPTLGGSLIGGVAFVSIMR